MAEDANPYDAGTVRSETGVIGYLTRLFPFLVALVLVFACGVALGVRYANSDAYENGVVDGWADGHSAGWQRGWKEATTSQSGNSR